MKSPIAFFIVLAFASSMFLAACGKTNPPTSEKDVPDSALTDSITPSGENEYLQDSIK